MTGITHFEDLPLDQICEALDLNWIISEKLDGTFIEAGLDSQGVYYTRRKGGEPIYSVDSLPEECWTSTYRAAHMALAGLTEALYEADAIEPGQYFGCEVMEGNQPNTAIYKQYADITGVIYVTTTSFTPSTTFYQIVETYKASFHVNRLLSQDGNRIIQFDSMDRWDVKLNYVVGPDLIKKELSVNATRVKILLLDWLDDTSNVDGFTVREVLDINLGSKHPNTGNRKWTELRAELKRERARLQDKLNSLMCLFKDNALAVLLPYVRTQISHNGGIQEGIVVKMSNSDQPFKLVNRPEFTRLNLFTHQVKYWLTGGRRPARPCFLSRTKDWPKEKRLARLDVLLNRYLQNRFLLRASYRNNGKLHNMSYSGDLNQRTLNLFADVRKRIQDGR